MPPRRRANFPNAREAPVDEVYECDEIAQLRQQVEALTHHMATMTQQHQGVPNSPSADEDSNDEDNPFAPFQLRQRKPAGDDSRRWESGFKVVTLQSRKSNCV